MLPTTTENQPEGVMECKHVQLNRSINALDDVEAHLESFLSRVRGPIPVPVSEGAEAVKSNGEEPTLQDILQYGPERINIVIDRIHNLISDLESTLF